MSITEQLITDRLKEAEQNLQGALKAVEHWGGRVAELRELAAMARAEIPAEPTPRPPAESSG